ncbi:peroxisomal trans-2-enoyl-CoA reductase [Aplysia californica]|uniref:Peroxisomal trans-2-enoyl-CoA reductase n=1 Tax=Aplysia californica TaxID=6500 RepID=A0ABM1A571_APLCA|nr:peroxisomal trans-2-enoyl-CoA reductase [Aplysia californica]
MKVTSVFRPDLFAGKAAIVTGGGTGIGKAITYELLYLGCNVMIASRKLERLEEAAKDMRKWLSETGRKNRLEFMVCNIRKVESVQELVSTSLKTFGRLDFLVNNGGGQFISPSADISLKGFTAVVETNLTGTFLMSKEVFTQWMRDHGGSIVNITMDMWKGYPMMSHSGAARAGVDNLTKSLALEWISNGVRVNSVAPGSSIYSETAAANYGSADIFEAVRLQVPAQRLGTVEEVSTVVCFLLSPSASFVSGVAVPVDAAHSLYMQPSFRVPEHQNMPEYTWEKDLAEQQRSTLGSASKGQVKAKL